MSLQLPKRFRRAAYGVALGSSLLLLGACSAEDKAQADRWAMPANSPGTEQAVYIADLWKWSWVAALATGIVVWALIFYASWRYRRRSESDVPVQTRYNLPLEIFYTIAPIMMVIVFFYWTVVTQDTVLEEVDDPDHTIEVVGQQWSWTFNYSSDRDVTGGQVPYTSGTGSNIPTLVLPVDQIVEFKLSSPDVIHSFWIPGFLMKMDIIPGQVGEERNSFQVTPTEEGTFKGKCTELCGVSHSRMLFNVEVVSLAEYESYLQDLEAQGFVADEPLLGGEDARTQAGLDAALANEGGAE
ncbi:aa3-type cytochrome oxidase subunit II [Nocardioides donggukensis]|uniref:cytochrome-c oxidase n=1 Tax=Nocardioides donggukensis TaxID=2774019 RepID=A0A927K2J2_9ACTN|nr:cytochrome c oxidase subunit II [Nocardioides donggukensis]MBD8869124.1 cytochrome c oxidase subunit II [Nocardioides donggukensis]